MTRRLHLLALVATSACGRFHFGDVPPGDGGDDAGSDGGGVHATTCTVPPRPSVSPDRVVGNGDPTSCTAAALQAALSLGGIIGFDCGPAIKTISVSSQFEATTSLTLVGDSMVELVGTGASRIMNINAPGGTVTLIGLAIRDGFDAMSGGGIYLSDGDLVIYDSVFADNATNVGASAGGGAIVQVPLDGTIAAYNTKFLDNRASNGGAIMAFSDLTLVNVVLSDNTANGSGGMNASGGLGGAISHSGDGALSMCGVEIANNNANGLGGGIHRVCTTGTCTTQILSSSIHDNTGLGGGALYMQNTDLEIRQSSFVDNTATGNVGGVWQLGTGTTVVENSMFVNNISIGGVGTALVAGAGMISWSTFAQNGCSDSNCTAAINGPSDLILLGLLVADNFVGGTGPKSCLTQMADGAWSLQWPNEPTAPCAPNVQFRDPMLGGVGSRTGPAGTFSVASPIAGSPAIAHGEAGCPTVDLLGTPRATPCTAGAIETAP